MAFSTPTKIRDSRMDANSVAILGIVINGTLAAVTAAYVWLTWRLSKQAERSADYSRIAAESAAEMASLQRAQLDVNIKVSILPNVDRLSAEGRQEISGIQLTNTRNSVWLRSAHITKAATVLGSDARWFRVEPFVSVGGDRLPLLLQGGDKLDMLLPGALTREQLTGEAAGISRHAIDGVRVALAYSVDQQGPIVWKEFESIDFVRPA